LYKLIFTDFRKSETYWTNKSNAVALCVAYQGKEHEGINCFVHSTSPHTDLCVFRKNNVNEQSNAVLCISAKTGNTSRHKHI